ncbi:M1 family aminopeptidase [Maribacter sp. 2307UL18-2]|uniref:M1 family aminopeptidase n=1 Tax=Maribacter sp. 2307UL18-2 TaxID=3386274 RepID=UPI0039BD6C4E
MKYFTFLLVLALLSSCENHITDTAFLQKGVPLVLAQYRYEHVSEVTYDLSFTIPETKESPIAATLLLALNLSNLDVPLILDFKEDSKKLKSLKINGKPEEIIHTNEHLVIPNKALFQGGNEIEIAFDLGELSLNRNEAYLYTLLVPDRARTLLPCFDQPNIKGKYTLTITAPENWQVLCGAPLKKIIREGNSNRHQFKQTEAISTYLFSFVAGEFQKAFESPKGIDMNLFYRENDSTKIKQSIPDIFNAHQQSVQFLEDYTSYDFPFQKLDYATIPGFQYGGMEHVGAIQYREGALFMDQTATDNQRLRRAKLIAHETAHMWFGNLVTMDWFDDVWMKEVFANFMADKIVNPAFPDIDHDLAFMVAHYPRAFAEDRTLGTNPIRQPLENLNDAGSLYGSIIYNKAPIMMRQLETAMGKKAFQKGIQRYLKKYAYDNATWNDLVLLLDEETPLDLKAWSEIWVNRSSRPLFQSKIKYASDNTIASFILSQTAEDGSDGFWPQSFNITLQYPDTLVSLRADIQKQKELLVAAKGLQKPEAIIYNSDGMGYGVFPVEASFLQKIPLLENPVTRGYGYINIYENVLTGTISASDAFQLYKESLITEKNELLVSLASNYLNKVYWKYLSKSQRAQYQQPLEKQLLTQLKSDLPANSKKILFGRFRSIAYSESGKEDLFAIWNKTMQIPNLRLNQDDYTAIGLDLVLYGHPQHKEILEQAQADITNPDKLERFKFLMPAVSNNQNVRDTFFASLQKEENRGKENWTLTALGYLNHPARQKESAKYLARSLAMLDEIQKTGDIFFPKGWLNNTIGKYTSKEAFSILESFIKENPDMNPALLKKLRQASDDLRRVQLLHKKVNLGNN